MREREKEDLLDEELRSIHCLPIVLSTAIHRGYIVNISCCPPRFPLPEIPPEIHVPRP